MMPLIMSKTVFDELPKSCQDYFIENFELTIIEKK